MHWIIYKKKKSREKRGCSFQTQNVRHFRRREITEDPEFLETLIGEKLKVLCEFITVNLTFSTNKSSISRQRDEDLEIIEIYVFFPYIQVYMKQKVEGSL